VRTTLTLDPDVAARIEALRRKRRQPFKAVVNDALRTGLDALERPSTGRRPFRTTGFDLGPVLVGSLDNIEDVLSRVEGEERK
jgi:Ribbon-helix-helix protein, copG family